MGENISALEIDRKIREDFRRRLKDYGLSGESIDPILAVLFRTFSHQLEGLYNETGHIRLAILDELINNLGFTPRIAHPAQTIVRMMMLRNDRQQLIPAGTELNATAPSGEKLTFTTDESVKLSAARLVMAFTYQDRELQLSPAVDLVESLRAYRPALEGVRCDLGPEPAIFLAFDNVPDTHLTGHSLFLDLHPDAHRVQQALWREPWCLVGPDGELSSRGLLRPQSGNAGVQSLEFLIKEETRAKQNASGKLLADIETDGSLSPRVDLPNGFYGGRLFVLPTIPRDRQFSCHVPRGMETALRAIFGPGASQAFAERRVWVRLSLPLNIPRLQTILHAIYLHAVSASNVECLNQTIQLDQHGSSIPVSREAGSDRYLVAPLSIFGEADHRYVPELSKTIDAGGGTYGIRNGRIHLQPAHHFDGTIDRYVNLRLWSTSGALGNSIGPGHITGFIRSADFSDVRLFNSVSAAGGTNGEDYSEAHSRFASALLSRNRIITAADLARVVRAFDRRIVDTEIQPSLQRTPAGLQRLERVIASASRASFIEPDVELPILQLELGRHLRSMLPLGTELAIQMVAV